MAVLLHITASETVIEITNRVISKLQELHATLLRGKKRGSNLLLQLKYTTVERSTSICTLNDIHQIKIYVSYQTVNTY